MVFIYKSKDRLNVVGCVGLALGTIVIILVLYVDDIVLMPRNPYDLKKKLRIVKDGFSSTGMTMKTDKKNTIIVKSQNVTYDSFIYDNNILEEVSSQNCLGIDIYHKLN
jgi:hypothetical protein